nr:MAG TPA: PROTEIN/RNA Complex, archaeal, ribosomal, 50S, protein.0A [Caudoviricetes sp.]
MIFAAMENGGPTMAKEYIEREKIWNHLQEQKQFFIKERDGETDLEKLFLLWGADNAITIIEDWLSDIPSADVAPVRHGRLVSTGYDELYCEFGDCTICGADNPISNRYCGQCGAKMDLEG